MRSYLGITTRYLKVQRRRTFLTILGIILSAALISGIGTIGMSFLEKMLRDTIDITGDYYAKVTNIGLDKIENIKGHVLVDTICLENYEGFADKKFLGNDKGVTSEFKGYNVVGYDKKALSMLPIKIESGRMPENADEIVIGTGTLQFLKSPPNVGEKIELEITPGSIGNDGGIIKEGEAYIKEYKVVGYLDSWKSYPFRMNAITLCDSESLKIDSHNSIYIKLKNSSKIKQDVSQILLDATISQNGPTAVKVSYNDKVLRLLFQAEDKTNIALIACLVFLGLIVIISMIAVIYNTFNISIFERVSQFGLLRCVGSTPSQIRCMVFKEATILGGIGIPIGILLGTIAMQVLFSFLSFIAPSLPFGDLKLIISPYIIALSFIMGFIAVYLSAFGPARKAGKISPMEAVKNIGSLKKEKLGKISSARFAQLLFGAEGWMAQKNLGRNRIRLVITVLSMIISIVLFIVFSSFIDLAYKTGLNDTDNEMVNFTIQNKIDLYGDVTITPEEIKELASLPEVKTLFTYYKQFYKSGGEVILLPKDKVSSKLKDFADSWYGQHLFEGEYIKFDKSHVIALGDNVTTILEKYLEQGDININTMNKENGVIVVETGEVYNTETKSKMVLKTSNLRPGDMIKIKVPGTATDDSNGFREFKVMAVLKQGIWGEKFNENGGINIYTTEKIYKDLTSKNKQPHMILIEVKSGQDTKLLKERLQDYVQRYPDMLSNDYDEQMKEYFQSNIIISIFVYGFFCIIALIGCVNIINTISTNIILRTRELSILKAIGMTQNGIKKLICLESILYGVIACILGTVIGCVLSFTLYKLFYGAIAIEWNMPWKYMAIGIVGTMLVTLLAGYIPLKRINNAIIVENIREEQ